MLTRALRLLVYVMVPIGALFAIVRVETVSLLFDDGSYGAAALALTAATLFAFLVGLAAHALIAVLARAFYARQDTLTPVLAAVGAVVVNVTLAVVLVGPLGLPGVALAIAIAAWLEAIALDRHPGPARPAASRRRPCSASGSPRSSGRSSRARPGWSCAGLLERTIGPDPGKLVLALEIVAHERSPSASSMRASRSPCGSRNCRLSSGSWSTCSAARDRRDGAGRADRSRGTSRDRRRGTRSSRRASPGRISSSRRGPASRRPTAGRRTGSSADGAPDGPIGAQILVRRPRPMPWAFAYAPRGPVAAAWTPAAIEAFTERVRADLGAAAGRVSHLRIDPEIEADGPLDPERRPAPGAAGRGLAAGAGHPAGLDAGHRPARPTRTPCGATCARSGAST